MKWSKSYLNTATLYFLLFILSKPLNGQPTVTYPSDAGITWFGGSAYNITWSGFSGSNVKIELYRVGKPFGSIIASTANDGSYAWTVPLSLLASTYKIRITSIENAAVFDDSNNDFTIKQCQILYPTASGISWNIGASYNITWSDFNGSYVKIDLYKGTTLFSTITSSTANDNSYSWTVSNNISPASDYYIRISSTANEAIYAQSYYSFAIVLTPVTASGLAGVGTTCEDGRINLSSVSGGYGPSFTAQVYGTDYTGRPVDKFYGGLTGSGASLTGLVPSNRKGDISYPGYHVKFYDNQGSVSQEYNVVIEQPDFCTPVTASGLVGVGITCEDGRINISSVSGGYGPSFTAQVYGTDYTGRPVDKFYGGLTGSGASLTGLVPSNRKGDISYPGYHVKFYDNQGSVSQEYIVVIEQPDYCVSCSNETFTTTSGTITDNSGASDYLNNMSCEKLIQPPNVISITLTFTSFNTEAGYDFVRVYDGPTTASPLMGTFSGTSIPPILTSSNGSMLIRFTTDNATVAAGWSASYTSKVGTVGISEQQILPGFNLVAYPNPTSGILTIESSFKAEITYMIELISYSGQVILKQRKNVFGGKFDINLSDVGSGSYLLKIMNNSAIHYITILKK